MNYLINPKAFSAVFTVPAAVADKHLKLARGEHIKDVYKRQTEESAKAYFELLHPKTGEIADDELDNVAGGCNKNDGRKIVSVFCICNNYACSKCGGKCIVNAVKSAC